MLENTLYLLKQKRKLTVGFFGGSITEGAGASDAGKTSWRGAVTEWLREKFSDCEISTIQAAIGGTGSMLGIFREERDLLEKSPDLVFIEFSVNDGLGSYEDIVANSEAIVRKIYAKNPYAEIVYLHTTTKGLSDHIAAGGEFTARSAHSAVMHRYGIPQIDVGEILRAKVNELGGDWKSLTIDTVHPNDEGYKIYTEAVVRLLGEALIGKNAPEALSEKNLPGRISDNDRTAARLVDAFEVGSGWNKVERSLCGRYDHYIESKTPGEELELAFDGRRVGLYCMLAKDSGDLVWSIDGGAEQTVSTWDKYCKSFNRAGGIMLGGELESGRHLLKLRVSDKKSEESEGNAIRIGAFMVY